MTFWLDFEGMPFPDEINTQGAPQRAPCGQLQLILLEGTAIGVRLSHASRGNGGAVPGGLLSNTWATYPREGDNPGKLGLIPHRGEVLGCPLSERVADRIPPPSPEDGPAAD
jgi:hypothetical protein